MRRSLRDAIVGFSLIGGIALFSGSMLWLRGIRFSNDSWTLTARFKDASGLSEMSPVTYRGIIVGSVKKVNFDPISVKAKLEINYTDLLFCPIELKQVSSRSQ